VNRIVVLALSVLVACLAAPAASAKGASEASISGPGLASPIKLAGEGQPGGEQLMQIAEQAGFFAAVFGQTPDPMLAERPQGTLGPKYTVEYVMPGPNNETDSLVQDVYPYATPSPVTYVAPEQPFWTTEHTVGGWFVATSTLKDLLVDAGLPQSAPTPGATPSDPPWKVLAPIAVSVLIAALVALAVLLTKRPQPA
jgi:hypothetical protein